MHILFDKLIVAIVSAIVVLMLFTSRYRTQQASIEAAQYYANRVQSLHVVDLLGRDLRNAGAGLADDEAVFLEWTQEGDSLTRSFAFHTMIDTTADALVVRVRYQLIDAANSACAAVQETCYQLQRHVDDGSGYLSVGGSTDTITRFDLALEERNGSDVGADWEAAQQVAVHLASMSPLGQVSEVSEYAQAVPEMVWNTRIRPPNLHLRDE